MKLLTSTTDYNETIELTKNLKGIYDKSVIFHCYWNGNFNEKHLYSIISCYYFNVKNNKHKIILWLENNISNEYNIQISKYCEIREFNLNQEKIKANINYDFYYNTIVFFYSDVVRYFLLYNYGGCWFDLDCFFLKSFDSIFVNYETEICVYQWEQQNYPNGAIFITLEPKSDKMKKCIEFIIKRNRGWGFKEANLTYDIKELDMLVLPCSWFNGDWIENPYNIGTVNFFKTTSNEYNFNNFFEGAFCYHWHNKWNIDIEYNSIILQLVEIIKKDL